MAGGGGSAALRADLPGATWANSSWAQAERMAAEVQRMIVRWLCKMDMGCG